jgi:16S rRNA processing protein RimM
MVKWDEMALVGRIARAHGLKGQVFINPETDYPELRFQPGAELFVSRGGVVESLTLTSVRFHRERPVVGLGGIEDMDQAAALAGLELRVPIDWLVPLPEGTFYRHELIGCLVETTDGAAVGQVKDVEGDAAGSRLVLETPSGEVLVPLAQNICPVIDIAGRRIVIAPPEGLLELNADRHRHHLSGDGGAGVGSRDRGPRH